MRELICGALFVLLNLLFRTNDKSQMQSMEAKSKLIYCDAYVNKVGYLKGKPPGVKIFR